MAPNTIRTSPTPLGSQSSQASSSLSSLASQIEIPTNLDLTHLVDILQDRKSLLSHRRQRLAVDESKILQGRVSERGAVETSLVQLLDGPEEQSTAVKSVSVSPTTTNVPLAPPTPAKGRFGHAAAGPSASPAPGNSSLGTSAQQGSRTKIKIKRDPDREREDSEPVVASVASSSTAAPSTNDAVRARQGSEASASVDVDWEEEGPSRPGRTYQKKRKRQRNSQSRDLNDLSQSEADSPRPATSQRTTPQRELSMSGRAMGNGSLLISNTSGSAPSSIKLKLNPTTHTAPIRNDSMNASIRRPSILRGKDDFASAMTPMQASQAAQWELPSRTAETFIPQLPLHKPVRWYPTRPEEVDVDFSKMDWKERDKERDRLEAAAAAAAAVNGPGPGQAIVKESSSTSRARDRKQDQVAHHIFIQHTDAWFRTVTEEDLAYLSSERDATEAFRHPSLGRHYSEVWAEEEANGVQIPTTYLPNSGSIGAGGFPATTSSLSSLSGINRTTGAVTTQNGATSSISGIASSSQPVEVSKTSRNDQVNGTLSEDARAGPLTERLLAALLPTKAVANGSSGPNSSHAHGDSKDNSSSNSSNSAAIHSTSQMTTMTNGTSSSTPSSSTTSNRPPQDPLEYEERIRNELKNIGLLDEETDWSQRADDEISSTLRRVQKLLEKQIKVNKARKTKLFEIAQDRLAYQDYLACLFSTEREIEAGWLKRQTQIKKSMQAQKKKKGGSNGSTNVNTAVSASLPTLTGLIGSDGPGAASSSPGPGTSTPGGNVLGATGMAVSSSSLGMATNSTSDRGGGPMPPQFSDALLAAIERRRLLKHAFDPIFDLKPRAKYTPRGDDSIYKDLDMEVEG